MVLTKGLDKGGSTQEGSDMAEAGALQSRSSNVLWRRKQQLDFWNESETNKELAEWRPENRRKVRFQDSDVFLSACISGDESEVGQLLTKGANINTTNVDGLTALHQAVIDKRLDIVKYLVAKGAALDAQDNEGWTPLHAAACCGHVDIAQFLLEKGADLDPINSDKELALDLADSTELRQLLEAEYERRGVDAEAARGAEERVMLADALDWQRAGVVRERPHSRTGASALHVAAAKGYVRVMHVLLQAGCDVNARDVDGWTPLHGAAHWADKPACEVLAEHLADFGAIDNLGQTCFDVADDDMGPFLHELQVRQAEWRNERLPVVIAAPTPDPVSAPDNDTTMNAYQRRKNSVTRMSTDQKTLVTKIDEAKESSDLHSQQRASLPPPRPPPAAAVVPAKVAKVVASGADDAPPPPPAATAAVDSALLSPAEEPPTAPWRSSPSSRASAAVSATVRSPVPHSAQLVMASTTSSGAASTLTTPPTRRVSLTPSATPQAVKEAEAERKAKSRKQRETRRSTQGVTMEQLLSAEKLVSESKAPKPADTPSRGGGDARPSALAIRKADGDASPADTSPSSPGIVGWKSRVLESVEKVDSPPTPTDSSPPISNAQTPSAAGLRRRSRIHPRDRRSGGVAADGADEADDTGCDDEENASPAVNGVSDRVAPLLPPSTPVSSRPSQLSNGYLKTNLGPRSNWQSGSLGSDRTNSSVSSSATSVRSADIDAPDYKKLYETERAANKQLSATVDELQTKLDRQALGEQTRISTDGQSGERERRALERRVAELEAQLADLAVVADENERLAKENLALTAEQLRADNQRLKDENSALIRVISKLSK